MNSNAACRLAAAAVLAALILVVPSSLTAQVLQQWQFNDPPGTNLVGAANEGRARFIRPPAGVATDGAGHLVVRRTTQPPVLYYSPLPADHFADPIWVVTEITAWTGAGETGEAIRLGFSNGTEVANHIADLRLERTSDDVVTLSVRASGTGATHSDSIATIPLPIVQPHRFALYYDTREHRYALLTQVGEGAWQQMASGTTAPAKHPATHLRLGLAGIFNDTAEEQLLLGHITLHRHSPAEAVDISLPAPEPTPNPDAITAESWAIADPLTGRIIASQGLDDPRKSSSITKTMCTYVVLQLAAKDPSVLEERVTLSEANVALSGTKTGLEAGESMRVAELLYAFMLPSGNDAGNAIAEHFNDRFPEPPQGMGGATASRRNFVGEMNRLAREIGMTNTIYRIPYGDGGSATDHTTTAADLIMLARTVMQDAMFRDIVGTKEFTGTVQRPDGTTYEKTWTNTNQFLGEPGFVGIKTGTTQLAGACLLTAYHRDGAPVLVVVLGSKGSATRYDDTRKILARHFPAAQQPAEP